MTYNKWIKPSLQDIKKEYKIEYTIKPLSRTGIFPTEQSFIDAVEEAEVVTVDSGLDRKIDYRSGTRTREELIDLVSTYGSWPEFRNEKTIDNLYNRFKQNEPLDMPMVLRYPDGRMRVFAGNTRMDVAFQLGVKPKVLMIDVPELDESRLTESNGIRNIIAIYPGRFQPFGPHHHKTFEWLSSKFGKGNTYIATSDKVELPKSPMRFAEKSKVIQQYGVPKSQIVQVKNPYLSKEILSNFDPQDTAVVFMYGKKDAGRLRYTKKDGTPGYFQEYKSGGELKGYDTHGYVVIAPHISIDLPGYGELSGTTMRQFIPNSTPEEFQDFFGWFDEDIYKMMRKRFGKGLNEISNGQDFVDDGPRFFYGNSNSYKKMTKSSPKLPTEFEIVDWIINGGNEPPNHGTDWPNGPVPNVSFFPAGAVYGETGGAKTMKDMIGTPAYNAWLNHIKNVIGLNDTMIDDIDADIAKTQKKPIEETIKKVGDKWVVYPKKGGKRLGTHDTKAAALKQLAAIEINKESTGGEDIDESLLVEYISRSDLKRLEDYADQLFAEYDIDVVLTKHFHERLNDPRNKRDITVDEMKKIFNSTLKRHGDTIEKLNSGAERVVKSMSTDINMPFVFQWDDRNQEFDLVAKTVMRKPNFKSYTPFLKVDSVSMVGDLLTEGGAFGHLIHPYEEPDMTFDDLVELATRALSGELNVEGDVQEKLDGQNLNITYKDGRIGAARNKSTIKNPMTTAEVASKFEGRGGIKTAFVEAMNDLEQALEAVGVDKLNDYFANGQRFLNIEVIFPETKNVIDYGAGAYLVLLGMVEYDDKGKIVQNLPALARKLESTINRVNAQQQNTFTIIAPKLLQIAKSDDFDSKVGYYTGEIKKIASEAGLSLGAKIGDYYDTKIQEYVEENFNLDDELENALVDRWSRGIKSFRFDKNNLGDQYEKFKEIDSKTIGSVFKKIRWPIEKLVLQVGADTMSNISDFLSANPNDTVQQIRSELKTLIQQARSAKQQGNESIYRKFVENLKRLDALGGFDRIIPSEGIVFPYKGRLMKFTGTYAPINQLLGLFRYTR